MKNKAFIFVLIIILYSCSRDNDSIPNTELTGNLKLENINVKDVLNNLINKTLPILNKEIPSLMEDNELDPMPEVASEKATLGIPIPIPTPIPPFISLVKPSVSYSINNMEGLSSIVFNSMTIDTIDTSEGLKNISGTLSYKTQLNSTLSVKVKGSIIAEVSMIWPFSDFTESVSINGRGTVTKGSASGSATFKAFIDDQGACFNSMNITKMNLTYEKISINIDGLGLFFPLLDPIINLVESLLDKTVKNLITSEIKEVFNKLIEAPICVDGFTQTNF